MVNMTLVEAVVNKLDPICREALVHGTDYLALSTIISWAMELIFGLIFLAIFIYSFRVVFSNKCDDTHALVCIISFLCALLFLGNALPSAGEAIGTYYYPDGALINKALKAAIK